jgi:hypothetical protein
VIATETGVPAEFAKPIEVSGVRYPSLFDAMKHAQQLHANFGRAKLAAVEGRVILGQFLLAMERANASKPKPRAYVLALCARFDIHRATACKAIKLASALASDRLPAGCTTLRQAEIAAGIRRPSGRSDIDTLSAKECIPNTEPTAPMGAHRSVCGRVSAMPVASDDAPGTTRWSKPSGVTMRVLPLARRQDPSGQLTFEGLYREAQDALSRLRELLHKLGDTELAGKVRRELDALARGARG